MTEAAVHLKLRYVIEDTDRYDNIRIYVRRPGQKKIRIRAIPGTDDFMDAYRDALAGIEKGKPGRATKDSFRWLCQLYYGSGAFQGLDVSTQSWQRRALDSIAVKHGSKPITL